MRNNNTPNSDDQKMNRLEIARRYRVRQNQKLEQQKQKHQDLEIENGQLQSKVANMDKAIHMMREYIETEYTNSIIQLNNSIVATQLLNSASRFIDSVNKIGVDANPCSSHSLSNSASNRDKFGKHKIEDIIEDLEGEEERAQAEPIDLSKKGVNRVANPFSIDSTIENIEENTQAQAKVKPIKTAQNTMQSQSQINDIIQATATKESNSKPTAQPIKLRLKQEHGQLNMNQIVENTKVHEEQAKQAKIQKQESLHALSLEGLINELKKGENEPKPKAQSVKLPQSITSSQSDTRREVQNTARANIWRPYESSASNPSSSRR